MRKILFSCILIFWIQNAAAEVPGITGSGYSVWSSYPNILGYHASGTLWFKDGITKPQFGCSDGSLPVVMQGISPPPPNYLGDALPVEVFLCLKKTKILLQAPGDTNEW
ncbi:hypothetical protein KC727_01035 [Candidatus Kaiserbacteria bacterium]|nr:hypothetical protein [Candidatus Kaiserbacteria bacterium]